jgi:hypothetical protein
VSEVLGDVDMDGWSERQFICSYICLHWILGESGYYYYFLFLPYIRKLIHIDYRAPPSVAHFPYLHILPEPSTLLTSLHFSQTELEAFKGTNLYWATLDRRKDWQMEWSMCRDVFGSLREEFTWCDAIVTSNKLF